jgi:xyloglucan-specific exo-beta-1,4-glucanase
MKNYRSVIRIFFLHLIVLCISILTKAQGYNWGNVAFGGGGYVTGIITHKTSGDIYCRIDVMRGCFKEQVKLSLTIYLNLL